MLQTVIILLLSFLGFAAKDSSVLSKPPVAEEKPFVLEKHGDQRVDEYFWLKERSNPNVLSYLKAENKYLDKILKPTEKLQKQLYIEMRSRIKEDDSSYPAKDGPYYYYTRYEKAKQYPIYARKSDLNSKEIIIFDINKLAKGHNFYSAHYEVSPNHNIAALSIDTVGRRFYDIKFKNLKTGKFLKQIISQTTGHLTWSGDNDHLFYVKQDPETLRWFQVYRYQLSTQKTELVYEEKDPTFETYLHTSLAKNSIFISSSSTLSNEVRVIPFNLPLETPKLLFEREAGHEFSVSEDEAYYYILSNKNAQNFQILSVSKKELLNEKTPYNLTKAKLWLKHRSRTHLDGFIVFKDFIAVASRENARTQIEIINKATLKPQLIELEDSAASIEIGANNEFDTTDLRYNYESLRSPSSVYDYNVMNSKSLLKKQKTVPNYNQNEYISERIFATARDGKKIPVSILRKKTTSLNSTAPLLVYGYGSYGSNLDPWFSSKIISLVDRGFIYAIAHIRGGGELGREWTDEGRTLKKMNTFNDFIDATEYLIETKYANSKKVYAMGGSAGGLLMGAVANIRPDLYKGIVAQVPFVDVITTMLDDSIPLTTSEYDEWGNPNEKVFYDYMKSYSPYDNVKKQAYPHILIETGLHDSQVQYWEPAKWAARLRKHNSSQNLILLKTDMESGHGGKTGRFDQLKEDALEYAFILFLESKL